MSAFEEKYDFKFADLNDVDPIMLFIGNEWKSDHILARNKEFFLYEFGDGKHINFVFAKSKETGQIDGIIGYLPASKDKSNLDIWGVMWKVTDKRPVMPFLGIELMKRLVQMTNCRTEIGIGANPKTSIPLLKIMLNFWVGKMKHYYRLSGVTEYKVAKIMKNKMTEANTSSTSRLKKYNNIESLIFDYNFEQKKEVRPYKDSWYISNRYFNHPIYKYNIYGVQNSDKNAEAVLVGRQIECNGRKVFRIVDFIGEGKAFSELYNAFSELLNEYEYIDLYCHGLKKEYVESAGFVEKTEDDLNIIPNYFEPFVQCNVDIWINSSDNGCMFFKADGDQDRPNFY